VPSDHRLYRRTPFGYDGSKRTTKKLDELLPFVLEKVQAKYLANPEMLIQSWPKIIGEKLAAMTRVIRFQDKVLYVAVKSSTLLSLLHTSKDKERILQVIKNTLPGIVCENIVFRIG
jgi:hypothetical protein